MPPILRVLASWAVITAASAGVIAALDRLPALVLGSAHGARLFGGVHEAERELGARLWMPAYFPDTLAWPPAKIQAVPGSPAGVALHVSGRDGTWDRLVVYQSLGGVLPPPASLLPPGQVITSARIEVRGQPARLERVLAGSGRLVHDLTWEAGGRLVVLRYAGPVEPLLLMADSLGGGR